MAYDTPGRAIQADFLFGRKSLPERSGWMKLLIYSPNYVPGPTSTGQYTGNTTPSMRRVCNENSLNSEPKLLLQASGW